MSLQFRLNAVIAGLLSVSLVALIALLLVQSTPRMIAETASMMRFAEAFARRSLDNVARSAVGRAELEGLLAQLYGLRHITVRMETEGTERSGSYRHEGIAGWLVGKIPERAMPAAVRLPVATRDGPVGTLIITPNPADEMAELLAEIAQIVLVGSAISFLLFLVTTNVVTRSLRPIGELRRALGDLQEGRFAISIDPTGPPELKSLAVGINSLAGALAGAESENERLSSMLVRLQDQERTEIARELHDEFGPHLFAARTRLTVLTAALTKADPDVASALQAGERVAAEINNIQATNRRVLQKLEPAGLRELGLAAALEDMADRWRRELPDVTLSLHLPQRMPELDATHALTVYRVVQEALTNAYKHAGAKSIVVEVRCREEDVETSGFGRTSKRLPVLDIEIRDNGRGLPQPFTSGFGLISMRQRLVALGGTLQVHDRAEGGVCVRALLSCNNWSIAMSGREATCATCENL